VTALVRWAVAVLLVLIAVAVLRLILGPVLATLLIAPLLWGGTLAGWASIERRAFPPARPQRLRLDRAGTDALDDARARALAQLADAYLAHEGDTWEVPQR